MKFMTALNPKTQIISRRVVEATENLYFFAEDDFEENEDHLESFGVFLDGFKMQSRRSHPSLSSDDFGSLDGLI